MYDEVEVRKTARVVPARGFRLDGLAQAGPKFGNGRCVRKDRWQASVANFALLARHSYGRCP